jgi:hypothetical protein
LGRYQPLYIDNAAYQTQQNNHCRARNNHLQDYEDSESKRRKDEMSLQTPRVLPAHLHAFHPSSGSSTHTVRILGTVTALHGDTATITCGNNGDVTLILKSDSHLQMGKLVEVVGKVTELEGGQVRASETKRKRTAGANDA